MEGLVSSDNKTVLPLKNVSVQVNVKGYLVGVSSTLSYSNETSNPLEVTFRFPLEESFAVVRLEATIDGRKIKASIHEKEKARDMYDDAITSGLSAAYAEEKSGDIFSLSLGNLPSGSKAEINMRMVGELPIEGDGRVRFTLPSVLKPRYTPEGSTDPLAAAPNPTIKHASVVGVFQFKMAIEGASRVAEVSSPTHQLKTDQVADSMDVCLAEEGPVRGDVTILIGYKDPHKPMAIVEAPVEGSKTREMQNNAVMLNFFPEFSSIEAACEFIFVVDRSGSMGGSYIKSAAETLVLFLKSIPEGCYFNIISFGSRYESFFSSSMPYNQETMEKSTAFAKTMRANFGGTELLEPLKYIFKQPPKSFGLPRQVFILTDGSVSNTQMVINEVRQHSQSARCFTFGIGSGASTALVKGIARAGNGSAEFIADNERMQSKVIRSLKKALQPSANNVAVKFDLPSGYEVKVVPAKIPSIYNGDKTVIYGLLMAKLDQKEKKVKCKATLTGDIVGKKFKFDIPFELPARQRVEDAAVIHQLAAKQMIQEWQDDGEPYENRHKQEIISLSCDASVVSKYTAYVAVDEAQNKPVSGSMQGYELTADLFGGFGFSSGAQMMPMAPPPPPGGGMMFGGGPPPHAGGSMPGGMNMSFCNSSMGGPPPPPAPMMAPPPPPGGIPAPPLACRRSAVPKPPPTRSADLFDDFSSQPTSTRSARNTSPMVDLLSDCFDQLSDEGIGSSMPTQTTNDLLGSVASFSAQPLVPATAPTLPKQLDPSFIVGLQQANGSWLLNDQLASAMSKSVEELKKCCPVSCDVKIWATLVVIEFLKKKYPSMMEELELVIMKAEQWLGKQVLPTGVKLVVLKDSAIKVF